MVKVKICGITNLEDALLACDYGADALGFNFYERSSRYIAPRKARQIIQKLPSFIQTVGIFVGDTPEGINEICSETGISLAQLHDDTLLVQAVRSISVRVLKTFRVQPGFKVTDVKKFYQQTGINNFLFDAFHEKILGGTGKQIQAEQAAKLTAFVSKFGYSVIAGGLNEKNIKQVVKAVQPYAVDVASGIEAEVGKKDPEKMRLFIKRAKSA
ncbi:MAG: phosphoribosylanthranilate isomerase [Chlorobiales bacterium]|nr:phosphoribosylanthranilate isomerase [Chlorobiales bacterium]